MSPKTIILGTIAFCTLSTVIYVGKDDIVKAVKQTELGKQAQAVLNEIPTQSDFDNFFKELNKPFE